MASPVFGFADPARCFLAHHIADRLCLFPTSMQLFRASSSLKHLTLLFSAQFLRRTAVAFVHHSSRHPSYRTSITHQTMSKDGKVVVVGSINQDLTTYASSLPQPGETLLGTDFVTSAGGKGSNQAVAAASIGIVQSSGVHMIGRVGKDDMGKSLLKGLTSAKVQIDLKESCVSDAHTGVASIVVDTTSGQNTIVVSPGANMALKPEEVSASLSKILGANADGKNVVLVQLEISPESALEALKTAKTVGAVSILNPAPAPKGWELSNEWYSSIDILIPNESELASLYGVTNGDKGSVTGEGEVAMAKALLDRGVQQAVIVTLGARGAMIVKRKASREKNVDTSSPEDDFETVMISEPDDLPCKVHPVVDAVGAGDAFCGALAAYMSQGVQLETAASMACGVASMSVRKRGAQESFPKDHELPACLRLEGKDNMNFDNNQIETTTITFVTGNKNKLAEVRRLLLTSSNGEDNSNIVINNAKIDLPELQGTPRDIAIEKCRLASEQLQSPVMIEDTSLCFYDLNGLPGPYIKWFLDGIGLEGLNIMIDGFKSDRKAYAQTIIAFSPGPGQEVELFQGQTEGTIVRPRGDTNFGWDPVFEPVEGGGKTYAEMAKDDKNAISHRGRAFRKFREYLCNIKSQ